MAQHIGVVLACAGLVGLLGCQSELDTNTRRAPIKGGTLPDVTGYPSVGAMEIVLPPDPDNPTMMRDNLWCGATLIAPQIALTAASCVDENLTAGTLDKIDLRFGSDYDAGTPVTVVEAVLHRYFNPDLTGSYDIAMVRFTGDPGVSPAPLNERALTADDEGTTVTLVGHGETDNGANDFGQRNKVDVPIGVVDATEIEAGTDSLAACKGDSGGPVFGDMGNGEVVIAISGRLNSCFANARRTRVDVYLSDFIYPYIDRFEGNCPADGNCDTVGCRTPDSDCDACAWQGPQPPPDTAGADCQEDCPTRDWDCPLGVFLGGECTKNGDCEDGGSCIAATDDPDYTYCTRGCDLAGNGNDCPSAAVGSTMHCEDVGGGVGECVYDTPSPGAQGFACGTDSTLCRSGICEETICVDECDPANNSCPDGTTCGPSKVKPGTNVCLGQIKSGGGGFCAIHPAGARTRPVAPTLLGLLLLGGVMFGLVWLSRRWPSRRCRS